MQWPQGNRELHLVVAQDQWLFSSPNFVFIWSTKLNTLQGLTHVRGVLKDPMSVWFDLKVKYPGSSWECAFNCAVFKCGHSLTHYLSWGLLHIEAFSTFLETFVLHGNCIDILKSVCRWSCVLVDIKEREKEWEGLFVTSLLEALWKAGWTFWLECIYWSERSVHINLVSSTRAWLQSVHSVRASPFCTVENHCTVASNESLGLSPKGK